MSGTTNSTGNKKDNQDWVSWALIIVLFSCGAWFFALPLLFAKLFGSDTKKRSTAVPPLNPEARRAASGAGSRTAAPGAGKAQNVASAVTKSPKVSSGSSRALMIIGGILAFVGLFGLVSPVDFAVWQGYLDAYTVREILQALALSAGGIGMFFGGLSMKRAMKRYAKYKAVIGTAEAMSIGSLSRKLGYSEKRVSRDLQKMIDKGYFGESAYLNMELGYFFRSGEADAEMTAARSAAAKKTAEARRVQEENGYAVIINNIRAANDRIADPVLSDKISHLEDITAKIFKAVEQDPSKRARIETFMTYYLPTTQKLLDSYAEFESTGVEGENLRQAKVNIEKTMDSIITGFERQLDELYKSDAMEVDSDISVMKTMLRRDTSTANDDFGLNAPPKPKPAPPRDVELGGSAAQEK